MGHVHGAEVAESIVRSEAEAISGSNGRSEARNEFQKYYRQVQATVGADQKQSSRVKAIARSNRQE